MEDAETGNLLTWIEDYAGQEFTPAARLLYHRRLGCFGHAVATAGVAGWAETHPPRRGLPVLRDLEEACRVAADRLRPRRSVVDERQPITHLATGATRRARCWQVVRAALAAPSLAEVAQAFDELEADYPGEGWAEAAQELRARLDVGQA